MLTGIAFLPEGDQFIVADYENRWVSLFEARGKFLSRFGMGKLQGTSNIIYIRVVIIDQVPRINLGLAKISSIKEN